MTTNRLSFQDQVVKDIDNVLLNADAKEFVTAHRIKGVQGGSVEHECQITVDSQLYHERKIRDGIENLSLHGLVFFIKKRDWLEKFNNIPKVESALFFDGDRYLVVAVADDMGILDITLEAMRGR